MYHYAFSCLIWWCVLVEYVVVWTPRVTHWSTRHVYTNTHARTLTHTEGAMFRSRPSQSMQHDKRVGGFFHMNTDALHVSTRRLTSFQHGKDPTVHTSMHYGSFTLQNYTCVIKFIHDSFKLNVTTVNRQAWMRWTWVTMNAMRRGCLVESCCCDVTWWCHMSKWSTNY